MLSAGTALHPNVLSARNEEARGRRPKYLYDCRTRVATTTYTNMFVSRNALIRVHLDFFTMATKQIS